MNLGTPKSFGRVLLTADEVREVESAIAANKKVEDLERVLKGLALRHRWTELGACACELHIEADKLVGTHGDSSARG